MKTSLKTIVSILCVSWLISCPSVDSSVPELSELSLAPGISCASTCLGLHPVIADLQDTGRDDAVFTEGCQALESSGCSECWGEINVFLGNEYRIATYCGCLADEGVWVEDLDCERYVADEHDGDLNALAASCSCDA